MTKPVCAIIGIGPGNGEAFAKKFSAEGYHVALLSRNEDYLKKLEGQIPNTKAFVFDAMDANSAANVFPEIAQSMGPINTLLYNAGSGVFGNIDATSLDDIEAAWRVNAYGLAAAVQAVLPQMREQGGGNIVVTGATSAVKHSANFTAFTSAKAAQRAMAQSLAKHLGPEKIHVSYVIVDGVIDLPRTREMIKQQNQDVADDFFLQPDDIASAVFYLTQQPQSAWTFELDVRPFGEKW